MIRFSLLSFFVFAFSIGLHAQKYHNYVEEFSDKGSWKQHVDYTMEVDVDVESFRYTGTQKLVYTNNSPDTLTRVFYHLYLNAFQPDSEMDIRSRNLIDPDPRVRDRISKLSSDEIGYTRPTKLTQNGKEVSYSEHGTILKVDLAETILPGETTTFYMEWESQLPIQIRRSGRNNKEGVALSMTQWFPKIAAYDFEGWHADPYIAREFYSVWGNYDVKINIDSRYTIGGTGYLQNPEDIGHGYTNKKVKHKKNSKLTWHFIAPDVHDFAWAADPDFIHDIYKGPNGIALHFFYKNNPEILENWKELQPKTAALMEFFNDKIGAYPYQQYSVIQGGDGGMEYAMSTLITGERDLASLVGVTAHELAHSWFQFVLASNESKYSWMDEGFTSYIAAEAMNIVMDYNEDFPQQGNYANYYSNVESGKEDPLNTHSDRYPTNRSYSVNSYSKGAVFLEQLEYIIGKKNLDQTLKRFFNDFKFQHPTPNDFIRSAEKVSNMELGWYLEDWTMTTKTVDYGIKEVQKTEEGITITLERIGEIPMPIDLYIRYEDNSLELLHIPLRMIYGIKENEFDVERKILEEWTWAHPTYNLTLDSEKEVKSIVIDATGRMADIDLDNNVFQIE